jgi:RNA polymerase sigma-70 factor (ECF subfamily)
MASDRGAPATPAALVQPTDARLIVEAAAGDRTAFEILVRRHYRAAYAVALARSGNRADAEDLVHDAFIRAAERLDRCRQPDRFVAWLCTIVRNLAHNLRARDSLRRATVLPDDTASREDSPDRKAQLADLREQLQTALATLPVIQREVVLLHDVDGRTHEEIAVIVGTTSGMCRQHLFKARKQLRHLLAGPNGPELPDA